jgi:hypothetical protein
MFGKIVMDVPADAFEHALDEAKGRPRARNAQDTDLSADDLSALIDRFLAIYREHTGSDFPTEPEGAAPPGDRGRSSRAGTASAPATTAGRTRSATTSARR